MKTIGLLVAAAGFAVGCTDNGTTTPGAADMAMKPPPPLYLGDAPDAGMPANFACLGSFKDTAMGPTMNTTITGIIKDFQDDNPVKDAIVTLYTTAQQVIDNKPIATAMASDAMGGYTIVVPAGTPYRLIRGVVGGSAISSGGTLVKTIPAYEFDINYNDVKPIAVKLSTKQAIPSLVSVTQMDGLGILAGATHDCDDKETGGGQIGVTATGYDPTGQIYYFVKVAGSTIPTRNQHWTAEGGAFAALNVPPGIAAVEATGIVTSGAQKTISKASIPVIKDAVTIIHLLPLAAGQ